MNRWKKKIKTIRIKNRFLFLHTWSVIIRVVFNQREYAFCSVRVRNPLRETHGPDDDDALIAIKIRGW